jgi:hypothetical protein
MRSIVDPICKGESKMAGRRRGKVGHPQCDDVRKPSPAVQKFWDTTLEALPGNYIFDPPEEDLLRKCHSRIPSRDNRPAACFGCAGRRLLGLCSSPESCTYAMQPDSSNDAS